MKATRNLKSRKLYKIFQKYSISGLRPPSPFGQLPPSGEKIAKWKSIFSLFGGDVAQRQMGFKSMPYTVPESEDRRFLKDSSF